MKFPAASWRDLGPIGRARAWLAGAYCFATGCSAHYVTSARKALRRRIDRPYVIMYGHVIIVFLYATNRAVSAVPFRSDAARAAITSPAVPVAHTIAAIFLLIAIVYQRDTLSGAAAGLSCFVWSSFTVGLFFAAVTRSPPLSLTSCALSSVITLASVLLFLQWGNGGLDVVADAEVK